MSVDFDTKAAKKRIKEGFDRLNLDKNRRLVKALDKEIYNSADNAATVLTLDVAAGTGLSFKRASRRVYLKLPAEKYKHRKRIDYRRWDYQIKTLGGALRVHVGRLAHEFVSGAKDRQELQITAAGALGRKRYRHAFYLRKGGRTFSGPESRKVRIYQRKRSGEIKPITPPKISIRKIYRLKKGKVEANHLRRTERIVRAYDKVVLRKWNR